MDHLIPFAFIDGKFQESGKFAHLALHIIHQVLKMQEIDIGKRADFPPGANVFPERPKLEAVVVEPIEIVFPDIVGPWPLDHRAEIGQRLHRVIQDIVKSVMMIKQGPNAVAAIARDVDIFCLL